MKYYYELVGNNLIGPLDGIYEVNNTTSIQDANCFEYVQKLNGQCVQAFTKDELIVTTKPIEFYNK